ncbi:MAG: PAS domain S-box protein [Bacteroidota bacterium]
MLKRIWFRTLGITLFLIILVWVLEAVLYKEIFVPERAIVDFILFRGDLYALHIHVLFSFTLIVLGIVISIKTVKYKTAEKRLFERQDEFRLLAENSNDVIWKMSRDGKFLYVSPSVEKLRGFTSGEVLGQSITEVLTPASFKTVEELINGFKGVMQSNPGKTPSVITELEQTCKDGSTIWTESSVKTIIDEKGEPAYFIGVTRDITERKQKELEIKRSEEYYRLMAETVMDYIIVHDPQGKILFTNPAGIKASGHSTDELIGSDIRDYIPEAHHSRLEEIWESRNTGDHTTFHFESQLYNSKGDTCPVEVSSAPVVINRTVISELLTARDISDRKKAEDQNRQVQEKIRKINLELEEKVKDRTFKLEQANKELESFSYSVSHDLHAPLRHISTFSGLLKNSIDKGDTGKTLQYLEAITSSVSKMKDLINSLLQLSRTGRSQLRKENFNMNLIVNQIVRDIEIDYPDLKINWRIADLGDADADIRLMKQVWYNLVSNAVKFSNGSNVPEIEIGKRHQENEIVWYIRDNGVGFDPKYMDRLFGVFQRLHPEDEFEGSGIGLATVKRIIDKHKGWIRAKSNPHEGAEFYFNV